MVPHFVNPLRSFLRVHQLEERVNPNWGYYDDWGFDDSIWYDDGVYPDVFDEFTPPFLVGPGFDFFDDPFDSWTEEAYFQIDDTAWFPIGADRGGPPTAALWSGSGTPRVMVNAYDPEFLGGVRVAAGDVNGDGITDLITAPGPGMPAVIKIFSGKTGELLSSVLAFEEEFTGGAYVASADMNRDGIADLIISPDEGGGPRVRILDGKTLDTINDFLGIDDINFRGGCRVAVGDMNSNFYPDLVVSAGFGGGPRIAVFDGSTLNQSDISRLVPDFYAFEDTLRNGAFPAIGDLNNDGFADLVFGGGPGGAPRVIALDSYELLEGSNKMLANFFAGDINERQGVQVGISPSSSGTNQILASPFNGPSASLYNTLGQTVNTYSPFQQSSSAITVGSAPAATQTNTSYTTNTNNDRRTADDAAFNHSVVISNLRGNYTGEYNTTISDQRAPIGSRQKVVRVEVVLKITSVTPESPNSNPNPYGGNYRYTGTLIVRPAGHRHMEAQVYGNFSCSKFPTPFVRQEGGLNLYSVAESYSGQPTAWITGTEWVNGRISTTGFNFEKPNDYNSTAQNGNLVLTKVSS